MSLIIHTNDIFLIIFWYSRDLSKNYNILSGQLNKLLFNIFLNLLELYLDLLKLIIKEFKGILNDQAKGIRGVVGENVRRT